MIKEEMILSILIVIFVGSLIGIFINILGSGVTGAAVTSTTSQVVISGFFSLSKSNNLTAGIVFPTQSSVPQLKINATHNYNTSNHTEYYVTVSADSNTAVDFCINGTALNTSAGAVIGIGNYTWNSTTGNNSVTATNLTFPSDPGLAGKELILAYVASDSNVAIGNSSWYRFWLNISTGQAAGTYNNTVNFQGVTKGDTCT